MSIFLNENSQGHRAGHDGLRGQKHTRRMLASGTNIVGGVNPKKAGQSVDFDGTAVPVFGSVAEAIDATGADVSVVFVPPAFTKAAVDRGRRRGDAAGRRDHRGRAGARHRGVLRLRAGQGHDADHRPELPRPDQPRQVQRRHHPGRHHQGRPRRAGVEVRHADLPDDVRAAGLSASPPRSASVATRSSVRRTSTASQAFEDDPETDAIVMIGEIGGDAEERAAAYIKDNVTKPVVGYVAGFTAPEGKTMGHAGAIVSGSSGTAQAKKEALEAVGVKVGKTPSETAAADARDPARTSEPSARTSAAAPPGRGGRSVVRVGTRPARPGSAEPARCPSAEPCRSESARARRPGRAVSRAVRRPEPRGRAGPGDGDVCVRSRGSRSGARNFRDSPCGQRDSRRFRAESVGGRA